MAERAIADRVCFLPVTAAIYQNGEEKLAMHWSFEIATDGGINKDCIYTNV